MFVGPEASQRAIDHMAKIGLGVARGLDVDEVRWRLRQTLEVVRRRLETTEAEEMIREIKQYWSAERPWQGGRTC